MNKISSIRFYFNLAFPIRQIADIQIHSQYKYYGNTSWREGNSPVTGTIQSKNATLHIGSYTFSSLIRLSQPVKKGDSGALVYHKMAMQLV